MDDDHYDTLCTFGNIPHTPAWYYKRYPGFFNVECYKILSQWDGGVPSLKEEDSISTEDIVFEEVLENKKRKYTSENSEEEEQT